jgi:hypothetical protein
VSSYRSVKSAASRSVNGCMPSREIASRKVYCGRPS